MKYVSASNFHENIQPYKFTFNTTTLNFAITYNGIHQLRFYSTSCAYTSIALTERVSSILSYQFFPYYNNNISNGVFNFLVFDCDSRQFAMHNSNTGDEVFFRINTLVALGGSNLFAIKYE